MSFPCNGRTQPGFGLIEDMSALIDAFPFFFLFCLGEMDGLLAGLATAAFIPGSALRTLDK